MNSTERENIVAARAYLLRVAEPPAPALVALIAEHGPIRAAELVRTREVSPMVAEQTAMRHSLDRAAEDVAQAAQVGARLVIPEDTEWPTRRFQVFSGPRAHTTWHGCPPIALWVRGRDFSELGDRTVTVDGSSASTKYGEEIAREFGYELTTRGLTVVSGSQYGIERAVHRGALMATGHSVVVLSAGIDVSYPMGNVRLVEEVAERGTVISEYPPGCAPARVRFHVSSRLLAALGDGTVVVEAGKIASRMRISAGAVGALGRPLMAVPGPITSATSAGCNDLLVAGQAVAVTSAKEVIQALDRCDG